VPLIVAGLSVLAPEFAWADRLLRWFGTTLRRLADRRRHAPPGDDRSAVAADAGLAPATSEASRRATPHRAGDGTGRVLLRTVPK
jgi:hypothetical protein